MHIWQAIKMAFKSLWTNKLRSFLTMLGIIIGVVTVSLLTTVAQGVSDAVVSSIRTQSTLSIMMCTSDNMRYDAVSGILKNNQHAKEDDDYYDYALVASKQAVISKDLSEAGADADIATDYLHFNKVEISQEQLDSMTKEERDLITIFAAQNKKLQPSSATIYAVDKNFNDVYELEMEGKFPTEANEILVDMDFVNAYLGEGLTEKTALGKKVSIGVKCYSTITLTFNKELSEEEQSEVLAYIQTIGLVEEEDSEYAEKVMKINVSYFTNISNEDLVKKLNGTYTPQSPYDIYTKPEFVNDLAADGVKVEDIYDIANNKTYTICGVLNPDNSNSLFSNMSSGGNSDRVTIFDFMMSSRQGTCYMLLDDSNLLPLNYKETQVSRLAITYAYLRFKTEDVMDSRINDLTVSMITGGKMYMQDFMIISMSSVANIISRVMDIMTIMLTVISVISLIVGGIGIMNIMLVAVTERTREIGIRKAIGAKRGSILMQFLIEALVLSLVGGAIGLTISAIGTAIIGHLMTISLAMPFWVIAMSVGFCTAIGLIFGMFPAVKASRMQPIDALRRE